MKHYIIGMIALFFCCSFLSAQFNLTTNPEQLVFDIGTGYTDSTVCYIANQGASTLTYSLLNNPPSLLGSQVAYYSFNNSSTDLITNTTAVVTGTDFVTDRLGQPQKAISFNATDHFYTQQFNLENTFSFSFWANPQASQTMYSEGYYNSALSSNYLLYPSWGGYNSRAGLGVALGTNGIMVIEHANSYMPCLLSHTANLTGWKHYTVVFGAHVPRLYINGVLIETGIPSQKAVTYMSYEFGGFVYGNYNGFMDDLCVYNSALSAAQVVTASQFTDNARYEILPITGSIASGDSIQVKVRMLENTLEAGTYNDVLTLYQTGTSPIFRPLPVTLHILPPVLSELASVSVTVTNLNIIRLIPLVLQNTGAGILQYHISTQNMPYNDHLSFSQTSGQIEGVAFRDINLTVDGNGLDIGVYVTGFSIISNCATPLDSIFVSVTITAETVIPLAPASLSINMQPNLDIMLQWPAVALSTHGEMITPAGYKIYAGTFPNLPGSFSLIGTTTDTQFLHSGGGIPLLGRRQFYIVKAYLD